ncbi:hypothetical protein [Enterococcus sp. AZ126]|uniref:hypothetical protein n=1 Tax=Enterococcus sp. AZ126 TaxID=2774635 RepID=UPI003F24692C
MKFVWYMITHTSSDIDVELFSSKKKMNKRVESLLNEFNDHSTSLTVKIDDKGFSVYDEDEMLITAEVGRKRIK